MVGRGIGDLASLGLWIVARPPLPRVRARQLSNACSVVDQDGTSKGVQRQGRRRHRVEVERWVGLLKSARALGVVVALLTVVVLVVVAVEALATPPAC